MSSFDRNNDAVFAGTTGNGMDLAVVVGRDHRCLPRIRKPLGKRLLTAYCTTPAAAHHRKESEDMSVSTVCPPGWQGQQRPAPVRPVATVAPAIWASLIIQQSL